MFLNSERIICGKACLSKHVVIRSKHTPEDDLDNEKPDNDEPDEDEPDKDMDESCK